MRRGLGAWTLVSLCVAALLGVGCTHASKAGSGKAARTVQKQRGLQQTPMVFDPTRIRGGEDELVHLDGYDAAQLFQLAFDAFQSEDYDTSRQIYERLVVEFPDADEVHAACFNAALSAEKLGLDEIASKHFEAYVVGLGTGERELAADGRIRWSQSLQRQGRYEESVAPLQEALAETALDIPERWEAQILLATASGAMGRHDWALRDLGGVRRALKDWTLESGERHPYIASMLWYHIGLVTRLQARAVPLDAIDDLVRLDGDLARKALLLLEARQHFKKCLRLRVPAWSGPSAFALGAVYEDFRDDLLAAPKPAELDAESQQVYEELLAERTGQFLERAIQDYEEILSVADRFRLEPAWTEAVSEALQRCRTELAQRSGTEEAEETEETGLGEEAGAEEDGGDGQEVEGAGD